MLDSTQRFSNRVDHYIRYRPRYPSEILTTLRRDCQLSSQSLIVDVGSGTGFLSELFLSNGNAVVGVEPNAEMRLAGEYYLSQFENFQSIAGQAEAIPLEDGYADFVVAGQAFHWFDPVLTRREFSRVLAPEGWVVLIWNDRETRSSQFLQAYEQLLQRYAVDYTQVKHQYVDTPLLHQFFGHSSIELTTLQNSQDFDFEGLKGRSLSSSYTPAPEHPSYKPMMADLLEIFQTFAVDGTVRFEYATRLYYARFAAE
ncbi:MAG: class I SAM-dependent methyltransferase [Cyanobacteria bacterium J06627_8]